MILRDIIKKTDFDAVWQAMTAIFDSVDQYKENFQRIFQLLLDSEPAENLKKMSIDVCEKEEPFWLLGDEEYEISDEEPQLQAVGLVPGDEDYYSIGALPQETLVGLDVTEETVKNFTPAQIAAYCMAEITYFYTAAETVWGKDGVIAASSCGGESDGSVTIDTYRREIGALDSEPKSGVERFFK